MEAGGREGEGRNRQPQRTAVTQIYSSVFSSVLGYNSAGLRTVCSCVFSNVHTFTIFFSFLFFFLGFSLLLGWVGGGLLDVD